MRIAEKRRENDETDFESGAFSHSATSPEGVTTWSNYGSDFVLGCLSEMTPK